MTLVRLAQPDYDPVAPKNSVPQIQKQTPVVGVNLPASNGTIEAFDNRILTDPALRKSFRYFIIAGGAEFDPAPNDILRTVEGDCRVLGSTPLNPAGDGAIIFNVGATLDVSVQLDGIEELDIEELIV